MTTVVDKVRTIGGSEVAAVLGLSPFRTPLDVWREKVLGQRDDVDTPATRAGKRFEPHILDAYRKRLPEGSRLWTPPALVEGYRRSTVDALAEVRGWREVVEAKATLFAKDYGPEDSDEVRLDYVVQGTWYAHHHGCDEIAYPVLMWPRDMRDLLGLTPPEIVATCELRVLRVSYSARLARTLVERVEAFWQQHVVAEVPPPAVDLEDIKRLILVARGTSMPVDEELVRLLIDRDRAKAAEKAAEARVKALDFAIRQKLGVIEQAHDPRTLRPLVTLKLTAAGHRTLRTTKHWKELQDL